MNELTIKKVNNGLYIDSREVAEAIGKNHKDLLRGIRGYIKVLEKLDGRNLAPMLFFLESTYVDSYGREKPCYLLTKLGCELCANKLIGEKGIAFTAAYVMKFNEMETAEREAGIKAHARPHLSEFNSAVKNVLNGMSYCNAHPTSVMNFIKGVYTPLGINIANDSSTPCFYSPTFIADFHGIHTTNGRPHSHAVSAIISKLNIHESQMVVVPYGIVGVAYRYDIDVLSAVADWIVENNFPSEVPYEGFKYHIRYENFCPLCNNNAIDLDDDFDVHF
jgi:Rha family phage regulatory protein